MGRGTGAWAVVVTGLLAAGCASTRTELERVAKDWCLTIRASQVLPVYPLSEDVQPGDVFVVQVPLSEQPGVYEEKGFLSLDQLAARLGKLGQGFEDFYADSYWAGTYAKVPHPRPGWEATDGEAKTEPRVEAPRVAFPTYGFRVDRGAGLKLALPLSGVPVGLGVMASSQALGTVTLDDAYTYAVDIETLLVQLDEWWRGTPGVRTTLAEVARQADSEVYLRVVNRVYLTRRVVVSLANLDAASAGVDAAAASVPKLLDLSGKDASQVAAAGEAYQAALAALAGPLNAGAPGGSVRFTQASQRAVTLEETFDRPLVIGYLGFDVRVDEDGDLSPPIPSFAVLNDEVDEFPPARKWEKSERGEAYRAWIRQPGNFQRAQEWLARNGLEVSAADLVNDPTHLDLLRLMESELGPFGDAGGTGDAP